MIPIISLSQEMILNGKIVDDNTDMPLPSASIRIKNTSKGYVTDFDGNFEIYAKLGDTLVFSYMGMESKELIALKSPISVRLKPTINALDEVTVSVGYFDVSKKDLSGSIVQIDSEQLEKNRNKSIESLLQGQVAGVVVNESSEPGGGIGISIRGVNSMLGGTQPLYVVDGIPTSPVSDAQGNDGTGQQQSNLGFLNPNDIEKIEVLKDAAATAIYGARGANGVVVITTKTADTSNGVDKISLSFDTSVSEVTRYLDVLDGAGFENYMNQRYLNQLYHDITNPYRLGGAYDGTQELSLENYPELSDFRNPYPDAIPFTDNQTTNINSNWQDITYRLAQNNALNLSYRGGDFQKNLSISLGLIDQEGVIINSNNRRITYNMNAKRKAFSNKVDFFSKTNISYKKGNASSVGNGEIFSQRGVVSQALQFQPIFSLLSPGEEDDIYANLNEGNIVSNPYTLAKDVTDLKKSTTFTQIFSMVGKISPKLTSTIKGSFEYRRSTRDNYYPVNTTRGRINNGEASQAYIESNKIYGEANLRYRNRFGAHRLDAILIGTFENSVFRSLFNKAIGYGSDNTSFYNFSSATEIYVPISEFKQVGLLSSVLRIGYNYKRKFYIDFNTRIDASSKFAANNQSAIFPSVALSWVISNERFLRQVNEVSKLKLRFSMGQTGSNPISPYQSLSLLSPIRYNFENELAIGYFESNLANNDLTWEKTDQFNIGFDLSLFDSSVNLTIDAYNKRTKDLLQNVRLPVSNGYTSRIDNFGEIENKGIEFSLSANITETPDFSWNILTNLSFNRNKLLKLNSNLDYQIGPAIGFRNSNPIMFKVGEPLGIFWGAQTNGIYSTWEEAIESGIEGAAPGEIKYLNNSIDFDENGVQLDLQQINFDDYVQIGDPNPDYNFSFNNNFIYKNWDLSILFTGQKGGDVFWVDSWQLSGLQKTTNVLSSSYDTSWRAPFEVVNGQVTYNQLYGNLVGATNPAAIINNGPRAIASDRQIFDGSFIRLKNINFGYTLSISNNQSLRIYASGQNLFLITDYPGYDPEIKTYTKNPQKRGVDFGTYPGTKTYLLGLKLTY